MPLATFPNRFATVCTARSRRFGSAAGAEGVMDNAAVGPGGVGGVMVDDDEPCDDPRKLETGQLNSGEADEGISVMEDDGSLAIEVDVQVKPCHRTFFDCL